MMRMVSLVLSWALAASITHADEARDVIALRGQPPRTMHQVEFQRHRLTPTSPDLIGRAGEPIVPLNARAAAAKPCATIFGFLPYWESSANIRWDLITHLAAFSVDVNSDGSLGNDRGWPWTSVINTAHANGVKVILAATLFDNDSIKTLINNPTYTNNFFVNIRDKILEGNADGLNVDFEVGDGGDTSWRGQIHTFMADLTSYLHTEIPGSEVTFDGPAVNWSDAFDLVALANSCDGIFIMGYAFAGSWSSVSGANAPLVGGSINITDTVLDEYGAVTQNSPEKLILGVPYYGHHWTTTSSAANAPVIDFISSTRFRDDQGNAEFYGRLWDAGSQTPWYRYQVSSTWHQVWYDDAESLGLKYQLAIDNSLQGVGMWALNYDGTRPELWDKLEELFVTPCPPAIGDADGDGDVDLVDADFFVSCLGGPDTPPPPVSPFFTSEDCLNVFDSEEDGDVDLSDFGAFQEVFTG